MHASFLNIFASAPTGKSYLSKVYAAIIHIARLSHRVIPYIFLVTGILCILQLFVILYEVTFLRGSHREKSSCKCREHPHTSPTYFSPLAASINAVMPSFILSIDGCIGNNQEHGLRVVHTCSPRQCSNRPHSGLLHWLWHRPVAEHIPCGHTHTQLPKSMQCCSSYFRRLH